MIRILNPQLPSDRLDFQKWASQIPQTEFFNWSFKGLEESFEKDICWGLWSQKTLMSVVCFLNSADTPEILWLATRPDQVRKGLMRSLLADATYNVLHQAPGQNLTQAHQILLEVHEKNLKAIQLYYSLGFSVIGRRKNYYKDGAQALLMALKVE